MSCDTMLVGHRPTILRTRGAGKAGRSGRARKPEHVLAEIGEDEVVRDGRHRVQARLAELPLDVVLSREPEAAVRVEAYVRCLPRRLRRKQLRHVRLRTA